MLKGNEILYSITEEKKNFKSRIENPLILLSQWKGKIFPYPLPYMKKYILLGRRCTNQKEISKRRWHEF